MQDPEETSTLTTVASQISCSQVLKTAGWANGSTFAKFYNKLPQNDNCGSVILQSYSRNETHNPS